MKIYSAVVSRVVPVGFADLAQAAEELPGREVVKDRTWLKVKGGLGTGLVGAIRLGGTLRTSSLLRPVKVEVVVSPWSAGRSEVAIQPVTNLGQFDSLRTRWFLKAAHSLLPLVIERLYAELRVEAPATVELAV